MKRVVSLSLGSSQGDKSVAATFFGEPFTIRRVGVNGDQAEYVRQLAALDGTVDAIGFGGMDRYVYSGGRRYEIAAAAKLLAGAKKTPVLDGSGLKNTLERETVRWLVREGVVDFARAKTLIVCGVDRFGLSEAVAEQGGPVVFGDLMFSLGVPIALRSWKIHRAVSRMLLPVIVHLPLSLLYPMGEKQAQIVPRWESWYRWADIIAGDFHYIRRHLPPPEAGALRGKTVLTNTTTEAQREELRERGVARVITTTPSFEGRTFGTNVMEAVLVALHGGNPLDEAGYLEMLKRLDWKPTILTLNEPGTPG